MNANLTKEIVKHILDRYGSIKFDEFRTIEPLKSQSFLLDKKIAIDLDGERIEKKVFSNSLKVEGIHLKSILTNIGAEEDPEIILIIQMNDFAPYCIRLEIDNEEEHAYIQFRHTDEKNNTRWVEADLLIQAQLLCGIEQIFGMLVKAEKNSEYQSMYAILLNYLEKTYG